MLSAHTKRILDLFEQRKQISFNLVWCENNLRWLLGDTVRDETLIAFNRNEVIRLKEKLLTLPNPFDIITT